MIRPRGVNALDADAVDYMVWSPSQEEIVLLAVWLNQSRSEGGRADQP